MPGWCTCAAELSPGMYPSATTTPKKIAKTKAPTRTVLSDGIAWLHEEATTLEGQRPQTGPASDDPTTHRSHWEANRPRHRRVAAVRRGGELDLLLPRARHRRGGDARLQRADRRGDAPPSSDDGPCRPATYDRGDRRRREGDAGPDLDRGRALQTGRADGDPGRNAARHARLPRRRRARHRGADGDGEIRDALARAPAGARPARPRREDHADVQHLHRGRRALGECARALHRPGAAGALGAGDHDGTGRRQRRHGEPDAEPRSLLWRDRGLRFTWC